MEKKREKSLLAVSSVLTILMLAVLPFMSAMSVCAQSTSPSTPKLPKQISVATWPLGTGAYTKTVAVGRAIEELTGMKVIAEGVTSDFAKIEGMRKGEIEILHTSTYLHFFTRVGKFEFEPTVKEYGPVPLRVVWGCELSEMGLIARGDSGIKTPADLKGKRVAFLTGRKSENLQIAALLAYGNLTEKDIIRMEFPSYDTAAEAVKQRKCDTFFGMPSAPYSMELEASPGGIALVELAPPETSAEAAAGWGRLGAVADVFSPGKLTGRPGARDKTVNFTCTATSWVSLSSLDDAVAYAAAKAIHEGYPMYKDVHQDLKKWTVESCFICWKVSAAPMHPGSIKYFKDKGFWKAEHEALQNKLMQGERARIAAWAKVTGKKYYWYH